MAVFIDCHSVTELGLIRNSWPDGNSYLDQEYISVQMFNAIRQEFEKQNAK